MSHDLQGHMTTKSKICTYFGNGQRQSEDNRNFGYILNAHNRTFQKISKVKISKISRNINLHLTQKQLERNRHKFEITYIVTPEHFKKNKNWVCFLQRNLFYTQYQRYTKADHQIIKVKLLWGYVVLVHRQVIDKRNIPCIFLLSFSQMKSFICDRDSFFVISLSGYQNQSDHIQ